MRKTHDKFVQEIAEKYGDGTYEFLSEYSGIKNKIKTRHLECGFCWDVLPNTLLQNPTDNPVCTNCNGGGNSIGTERFKEKVRSLVGKEYLVVGEYVNTDFHIKMRHDIETCGHEYDVFPSAFLRGTRCPKCFGTHRRTNNEFKSIVHELEGGKYIVIGEYKSGHSYIKMKHTECDTEFEVTPSQFIHGDRRCYCTSNITKGENKILNFLTSNKIEHKQQFRFDNCRYKYTLPFDFAVFDKQNNLMYLIEYDGEQHFKPVSIFGGEDDFKLTKLRDGIKNQYCKDNNIPLYRIPHWKYNEIEEILNKLINSEHIEVSSTSFLIV